MSDPNTLRILEIDGGGERGCLPLAFFKRFVQQWGVDPASIASQFDVICGTSIGGILALGLAFGLTPDEMTSFFSVQGPYIFSLSSLFPSVRPPLVAKVALILTDTPFYQSSAPRADKYGYGLLKATLNNLFGNATLQNLKTNVVIPSYQVDDKSYVLFSNLNYPDFIGQNELITNVALATGSAPVYFPALNINGHTYIDGGVYNNNPSALGQSLAQIIKPMATRTCILSLGTGIGELGFDPGNPSIIDPRVHHVVTGMQEMAPQIFRKTAPEIFDTIATVFSLFDVASVGSQESTSKAIELVSKYSINPIYSYRFQPQLDPNVNTELDNTDPEILAYYENTANQWYNNDIENIATFIGHLTA